jgi:hypothetical protein
MLNVAVISHVPWGYGWVIYYIVRTVPWEYLYTPLAWGYDGMLDGMGIGDRWIPSGSHGVPIEITRTLDLETNNCYTRLAWNKAA